VKVVHREGEHDDMAICLASTNRWANRVKGQPLRVVTADNAVVQDLMSPTTHNSRSVRASKGRGHLR
jgi:hypothetical protein